MTDLGGEFYMEEDAEYYILDETDHTGFDITDVQEFERVIDAISFDFNGSDIH